MDLFRKTLSDLTDTAFRAAVHDVLQSERFFPAPALLLEAGRAATARALAADVPKLLPFKQRQEQTLEGIEIFKRELRSHGIDVEELSEKFSWPGRKQAASDRVPGEEG